MREGLVRKYGRHVNNTDIMDALLNSWKLAAEDKEQSPKTSGTFINVKKTGMPRLFCDITISYREAYGRYCHGKLEVRKVTKRGDVVSLKLCCTKPGHAPNKYIWVHLPICQMENI